MGQRYTHIVEFYPTDPQLRQERNLCSNQPLKNSPAPSGRNMPLLTELEFLFLARTTIMPPRRGWRSIFESQQNSVPKPKGCEARATLGHRPQDSSAATRLRQFHFNALWHNLVEIVFVFGRLPKAAPTDRGNLGLNGSMSLELIPRVVTHPALRPALCLREIYAGWCLRMAASVPLSHRPIRSSTAKYIQWPKSFG